MSTLKQTAQDIARKHPTWGVKSVAYALLKREGKRPTLPVLYMWMQEARSQEEENAK